MLLVLEEVAVVDDGLDHAAHVVGLVRTVGHDVQQLGAEPLGSSSTATRGGSSRLLEGRKPNR